MATFTAQQIDASNGHHGLQFRVLGPVEVTDGDGQVIDVGGSKPRLVLVQLLLNPGRIVSTDALVDVLWGEDAPPTARRSLQSHVARLRAALGGEDGPLRSQPPGYVLAIDEAQVDLWRSEAFARQARTTLASDPRHALQLARQARAEWSGDPFADLADHDPLVPQRQRLDQNRLALRELEVDALLAVGDTSEAVDQLESLVLERPQHEPFWARLMTAYYRLGRQSDALRIFGRARTALMDELGIDPSPELQRLEVAILTQADELDFEAAASCPYKGLASYQLDDADRFCGRDDLVAELIEAVRSAPFVVVVGSSGAGKSSALRAGLISAIETGRVAGVAHGSVITPGATPMRSIYQVPRSADVVIVDQFEELFTLTEDEGVQREFVRVLLASVNDGSRRAVISLRADFYGNCMRIPELAAVLARRQVVVGAMSERELRTVVTAPAERAGLLVDGELVDAIVAEAADHPGALPLVSHALVETWHRRADARLTLVAYREAGSLAGAIARTAENVYGGFTSEQRVQTQRLLLRLVEPGEGSEHTRRRVPFAQLEGSTIDRRVVDVLIEARLLTADGEGVEIAHEALIDAWPRLSSWIEEDRHGLRLHRHLTTAASAWSDVGRDEGELYRGVRLSAALSWIGEAGPDLSQMERDFVKASVDLSEKLLRQQQRANRRLRVLVALSVVGVVVAAVGTTLAVRAARDAERGRAEAEASRIVATVSANPELSDASVLGFAVAADELASTPSTQGLLLDSLMTRSAAVGQDHLNVKPVGDLPVSANGGVILAMDENVFGVVIDANRLEPRVTRIRPVPAAVVDTGEQLLALKGTESGGTLQIVDLDTDEVVGPAEPLAAAWSGAALSPDGTAVAVATEADGATNSTVAIHDVRTGQLEVVLDTSGIGAVRQLGFSPDGRSVLAVLRDGGARVWDAESGTVSFDSQAQTVVGSAITRVAMSPPGTLIALGRESGQVEMWSSSQASEWVSLPVRTGHTDQITWLEFDPSGDNMVSTSRDGQVVVWNTATGVATNSFRFDGGVNAMTYFAPNSSERLVTVNERGDTFVWALQPVGGLVTTVSGVNLTATVAGTDEARVVVSSQHGLTVHDITGGTPVEVAFEQGTAPILGIAASADGTRAVVVHTLGPMELRDARSGARLATFSAPASVQGDATVDLSADGSRVAYVTSLGELHVVDTDPMAVDRISLVNWHRTLQALDLNSDGSELVVSTSEGEAIWYELDGARAGVIADRGTGFDAQFVEGGKVAFIGTDGVVIRDPRSLRSTKIGVGVGGRRLAVQPDGPLVATVDGSGAIQLWNLELGLAIGQPLRMPDGKPPLRMRFTADGDYLVVRGSDRTTWFMTSTSEWRRLACRLASNGLVSEGSSSGSDLLLGPNENLEACS